jgi:hypothetical protein
MYNFSALIWCRQVVNTPFIPPSFFLEFLEGSVFIPIGVIDCSMT